MVNPTIILTFLLLLMMIGAGSVSAFWGYKLGYQSLKGVSQPDVNPTKKLTGTQKVVGSDVNKGLKLIDEREVIVRFYDHTYKYSSNRQSQVSSGESFIDMSDEDSKLPRRYRDRGVTLEVVKVNHQDEALLLDVSLENEGSKAINFLYSFLDVRDDRGQALSAVVEGLPRDLPANGKKYAGTVKILPISDGEKVKNISLILTDYPEQNLRLEITAIPVRQ